MADKWETLEERELARVELSDNAALIARFVKSKPPDKDEPYEQVDIRRWYLPRDADDDGWRPTKTGLRISTFYVDKLEEIVVAAKAALGADGDAEGPDSDGIPF